MKKITTMTLGALGIVALASACSVEADGVPQEEVSTTSESLVCANHAAVAAVQSMLAVNIARELGRWKPYNSQMWPTPTDGDFKFNNSTQKIELTSSGLARCSSRPGNCAWTKATLLFQNDNKAGNVVAGSVLQPDVLRSRLGAAYNRQEVCMSRPDNGRDDNCPTEQHDLVYSGTFYPPSSCSADTWFHAYKAGTTSPLLKPKQLANMLYWAGWGQPGDPEFNPWIAFDTQGDDVKVDPTMGFTDGNPVPMTSGGVAKLPYNYLGTPKYQAVVSPFENITNRPCTADLDRCTVASGQYCPTGTRYFGTSFPTAPAGGAASPDGMYYCTKTAPN